MFGYYHITFAAAKISELLIYFTIPQPHHNRTASIHWGLFRKVLCSGNIRDILTYLFSPVFSLLPVEADAK